MICQMQYFNIARPGNLTLTSLTKNTFHVKNEDEMTINYGKIFYLRVLSEETCSHGKHACSAVNYRNANKVFVPVIYVSIEQAYEKYQ